LSELHYFDCKVIQRGGYSAVEKLSEYEAFQLYSDLDFNIKSRALISKLQKKGAQPSSKEVGNNYNQDDTMDTIPELWEFKSKWGEKLRRDISFVCLKSADDVNMYSKHPFTYKIITK